MSFYVSNGMDARFPRIFAYGQEKAKKTWWAGRAAEAGFNVTVLDGDAGAEILKKIPAEAQDKIGVVNLVQGNSHLPFPDFIAQFLRPNNRFIWDLTTRKIAIIADDPTHDYLVCDASKLNDNDFLVIDSWSALATDTDHRYAIDNRIDLSEGPKTEWDGYGANGRFLTYVATRLKSLSCTICVIGHATVYEKRDKDGKKIISQETQPISASGPHAKTLGKLFSDILYFSRLSDAAFFINTGGERDRVGGCRAIEPKTIAWDQLPPKIFTDAAGIKPDPTSKSEAFKYYPAGGELPKLNSGPQFGIIQQVKISAEPKVVQGGDSGKVDPLAFLRK